MLGRSIVVIEDDPALASLATGALESFLYAVFCTADPDEGFKLACTHRPAAVILDLTLNSVHSDVVYRRLQRDPRTSNVPIIICTVHRDFTIRRYLRAAPTHTLYKPFHIQELLETVALACKSRTFERRCRGADGNC